MMKLALSIITTTLALSLFSEAAVTKLSPDDRKLVLQHANGVQTLRSMRDIPSEVVRACAAIAVGHDFRLANPGERFEATDAITDDRLPRKRLIWAAHLPGYYIVHYEAGGPCHSYHVLLVAFDPPKAARVVWAAAAIPLKSYDEFLTALKTDKLDDTRDYCH